MLETDQIIELFGKHFRNELTPEEAKTFEAWLAESDEHRNLLASFYDDDSFDAGIMRYARSMRAGSWEEFQRKPKRHGKK